MFSRAMLDLKYCWRFAAYGAASGTRVQPRKAMGGDPRAEQLSPLIQNCVG
jgi:hypothetical protein